MRTGAPRGIMAYVGRFADRTDAGRRLAERVRELDLADPVVLALPRGGVPVGVEIARALGAPLDVLVSRKIGAPHHPEFGVGAVAEGGTPVYDRASLAMLGLTPHDLAPVAAREQAEVARRLARYRGDRSPVNVTGRDVIVVDDGLATGVTARAALRAVRARDPRLLVLAVPVCVPQTAAALESEADTIVYLAAPRDFRAVGLWYDDFRQMSDDEVVSLLEQARRGAAPTR